MNIILINQSYPPHAYGGIASYNYFLARALADIGHKVFVITKSRDGKNHYELDNGANIYRIKHLDFPYYSYKLPFIGKHLRLIRNITYSFYVCGKIKKINSLYNINVIEYAEIETEGILHHSLVTVPFVVRCHTPFFLLNKYYTSTETGMNPFLMKVAEKYFIKKATAITAPSKNIADEIELECNINKNSVHVIPNMIDVDLFQPSREKSKKNDITVLFVGRMERGKGIYVLGKAIMEVLKKFDNVRFIFIGKDISNESGDSSIEKLKSFLINNNTLQYVEIKGNVEERKLIDYYKESDIFVNPSLIYESFSYTCLQAMACGKPVIASRIGGIPEVVINGETGILFELGDVNALSMALIQLIKDPDLRLQMGVKGRKRTEENYSAKNVALNNVKLYEKVIMLYKHKNKFSQVK